MTQNQSGSTCNDLRDQEIYHYLNLDYFLEQLSRSEFYVGRKDLFFYDITEARLPLNQLFLSTEANRPLSSSDKLNIEQNYKKYEAYKEYSKSFVSSWTIGSKDDYLMWNVYAKKYGVCIVSTIKDYIRSLNQQYLCNYDIKYNKITYKNYYFTDQIEDLLFQKLPLYSSEKEFRFIFTPKDEKDKEKSNIWIPFDHKMMIKEVVLSPFFSIQNSKFLKEVFKERFGLEVTTSKNGSLVHHT